MVQTKAWILGLGDDYRAAIGNQNMVEYILANEIEIMPVPLVPAYSPGVVVWRRQVIPVIDLIQVLNPANEQYGNIMGVMILAYQDAPGTPLKHGALALREAPQNVLVSRDMACAIPGSPGAWRELAVACFSSHDDAIPILNAQRIFSSAMRCVYSRSLEWLDEPVGQAEVDETVTLNETVSTPDEPRSTHNPLVQFDRNEQEEKTDVVTNDSLLTANCIDRTAGKTDTIHESVTSLDPVKKVDSETETDCSTQPDGRNVATPTVVELIDRARAAVERRLHEEESRRDEIQYRDEFPEAIPETTEDVPIAGDIAESADEFRLASETDELAQASPETGCDSGIDATASSENVGKVNSTLALGVPIKNSTFRDQQPHEPEIVDPFNVGPGDIVKASLSIDSEPGQVPGSGLEPGLTESGFEDGGSEEDKNIMLDEFKGRVVPVETELVKSRLKHFRQKYGPGRQKRTGNGHRFGRRKY